MDKGRSLKMKTLRCTPAWILMPVLVLYLLVSPVLPATAAEPVSTTVAITSIHPSPAYIGQQVEVKVRTAAVNPLNGIPGGRVEIRSGQNRVCTLTLDAAGEGICLLSFTNPANVPLKAIYLGKDAFLPAVSAEINLLVKNKHTPVVEITSHLPDPSTIHSPVSVHIRLTTDGPVPAGRATIWRSNANCSTPTAITASDRCTAALSAGAGSCSLILTTPGDVHLCAAFEGDDFSFPAQASPKLHFVSNSNTTTIITNITPEPSVVGETVWVAFLVDSPAGKPLPTDLVKVTSGALSCTATIAEGRCPITFTTPHLHEVFASYQGSANQPTELLANAAALQPSTSRAVIHRVNAPPTDIIINKNHINRYTNTGGEVAVIKAIDPNTDESHTFSLAAGAGSEQNSLFRISEDRLMLNQPVPENLLKVSLRIRATDPAGLAFEKVFSLEVIANAILPATGFAADQVTRVLPQPVEKNYQRLDSVVLEIPALGTRAEITGVPNNKDGWDTDWLWNQVGWLNGTAFPGWRGNAVLAAHNYLPNGKPGPFAELSSLVWGDRILVHAYGETAVYEVRSVEAVNPKQMSVLRPEKTPWLTLITCKTFDEKSGTYRLRVVVRAEWVEVH